MYAGGTAMSGKPSKDGTKDGGRNYWTCSSHTATAVSEAVYGTHVYMAVMSRGASLLKASHKDDVLHAGELMVDN